MRAAGGRLLPGDLEVAGGARAAGGRLLPGDVEVAGAVRAAGGRLLPGDVEVAGGVVRAVGVGGGGGRGIAVPGLVDLQVNGVADVDFLGADADALRRAGAALLADGVTAVQPTFVSSAEHTVCAALRPLPRDGFGPRMVGAHLEGPFLSLGGSAPTTRRPCAPPTSPSCAGCSTPGRCAR